MRPNLNTALDDYVNYWMIVVKCSHLCNGFYTYIKFDFLTVFRDRFHVTNCANIVKSYCRFYKCIRQTYAFKYTD